MVTVDGQPKIQVIHDVTIILMLNYEMCAIYSLFFMVKEDIVAHQCFLYTLIKRLIKSSLQLGVHVLVNGRTQYNSSRHTL